MTANVFHYFKTKMIPNATRVEFHQMGAAGLADWFISGQWWCREKASKHTNDSLNSFITCFLICKIRIII